MSYVAARPSVGAVWLIAQAFVVAGFVELQVTGLRRAER
jgi:hypothetical protein